MEERTNGNGCREDTTPGAKGAPSGARRPRGRRARSLLAAVPRAARAAPGVGAIRLRSTARRWTARSSDVGFISDPPEGAAAAEKLRAADCDMVIIYLTTYLTSSMVLPIAQRANAPVLGHRHAAFRAHGPRDLRHRQVAGLLRPVSAPGGRQRLPAQRHRLPLGFGPLAPRGRVASDRTVGQRSQGAPGPPSRSTWADGTPLSGDARRLDRHDPRVVPVRRTHGGAGVRRSPRAGREGDRCGGR